MKKELIYFLIKINLLLLYNKTNLMNDSYIINSFCENNNKLSKLYFNDNKNYLIYQCFKNCSDKKFENDTDCLTIYAYTNSLAFKINR